MDGCARITWNKQQQKEQKDKKLTRKKTYLYKKHKGI
jgi:hypothetical protein